MPAVTAGIWIIISQKLKKNLKTGIYTQKIKRKAN